MTATEIAERMATRLPIAQCYEANRGNIPVWMNTRGTFTLPRGAPFTSGSRNDQPGVSSPLETGRSSFGPRIVASGLRAR